MSGLLYSSTHLQERLMQTFNTSSYSTSARINLWKANLKMFLDNPFFGVGFQNNTAFLPKYYEQLSIKDGMISHAHNNYMSVLGGTGAVGLIAYLLFVFSFIYLTLFLWKKRSSFDLFEQILILGCLGALINFHTGGLSEANYLDGEVSHVYIFILSLTIALLSKIKNTSNYR